MKGRVIFSSGGNYKVLVGSKIYFAKPLGIFRKDNVIILVGDIVEVEVNENKEGLKELNIITKLFERRNEFIRPSISNIDHAILVTSINEPSLNHYYLDKLITIFQSRSVEPILVFTKKDLGMENNFVKIIKEYENAGYKLIITDGKLSNKNEELLSIWTRDKISVITGQTGVGKSTLLNLINSKFNIKTQEISKALGRGKHTTRHSEIFEAFPNSFIIDTPGFSSLEITELSKNQVSWNFFDFEKFAKKCKFNNCLHLLEPGCNVNTNSFSKRTFDNYKKLLGELK